MAFELINNQAVINDLFKAAGYTYGPLLGLFSFGLLTNFRVRETITIGNTHVPALILVCLLAPIISIVVDRYSAVLLGGFEFGFLILAFNGLLTFIGLVALSESPDDHGRGARWIHTTTGLEPIRRCGLTVTCLPCAL